VSRPVTPLLTVYVIGALIGLWRTDGPAGTRLGVALLWPLGPVAFLVTISGLLVVACVALMSPKTRA
jgi:hypothetical protein